MYAVARTLSSIFIFPQASLCIQYFAVPPQTTTSTAQRRDISLGDLFMGGRAHTLETLIGVLLRLIFLLP